MQITKAGLWKSPRLVLFGGSAALFVYPSAGNPRVAVLTPGFRETRQIRFFSRIDEDEAVRFEPEVLAGTSTQLREIALRGPAVSVRKGVVVFTPKGEAGLTEYDRNIFWDAFGVPAFQQYLDRDNRLIATECDAHDGLHVYGPVPRRDDWRLDDTPCGCGNIRPRLMITAEGAGGEPSLCLDQR
jgi:hypothetical protein